MSLKPQNIVQAAEADLKRVGRNKAEADYVDPHYQHYAFHRKHVHMAKSARELMIFALMEPHVMGNTNKANMRLIYGDSKLLLEAIRASAATAAAGAVSSQAPVSAPRDRS